jgi:hypothetical protein
MRQSSKEQGVVDQQIIIPRHGDAKSRRDDVYSQALAVARATFPDDGLAAHRAAMRAADRATRMQPMFPRTPSPEERKNIDAALLEAFPKDTAGDRGVLSVVQEFPDYILARGEDGETYKITYTMKDGGGVNFGVPEETEGVQDEPETSDEVKKAKMNLAAAHRHFDNTIEGAGRIMRARLALENALFQSRYDELSAVALVCSAVVEYGENLLAAGNGSGAILCGVRESGRPGNFLAREAATGDGWSWPVRMLEAGWAHGMVGDAGQRLTPSPMPHYFPKEIVAEVAKAANGVRFRRRHPETGDGSDAPDLTAGWLSNARMSGTSALATVNLLKSETEIRSKLMAAREAGMLDLFSVSILAYFGFKRSTVEGKAALVATSLQKFIGLDMCAEPGAGGAFLPAAAG